jgi:CDP-diacylglycerol--glycerol-3-phosphate 3-phosphatidyltransferase
MTTTAKNVTARLLRRHRLLDAARGLVGGVEPVETTESSKSSPKKGAIKTFSLSKNHIGNLSSSSGPPTPKDFHSTLCHMIRNAQDRVCLASLYIGVGASPSHERELELLDALSSVRPEVQVQVLLDRNRALRKVPLAGGTKTCSAQAVSQAIQFKENHELYLLQVLPSPLKSILPNPLDEVAGVFHIKAYIIDDSLILSGANLSEEYFSDRQDRYIMIAEGGAGLVDFYAQLLDLLARHGQHYDDTSCSSPRRQTTTSTTKQQLAQQLTDLFVDPNPIAAASLLQDNTVVGVAIPTFQPPPGFFDRTTSSSPAFLSDVEVTHALLDAGSSIDDHHHHEHARVQLSSAYLNPTDCLLERLAKYTHGVDLLSAGRISHGFRPKPKAGNKGKDWIPQVFDHLARDACLRLPSHAQLWHWEREGWTFHSKGLWLSSSIGSQHEHDNDRVDHVDKNGSYRLDAAMIGSGNFGARSFRRDMESNCVFVFPDNSNSKNNNNNNVLSESLQSEWKAKQDSSRPVSAKELVETCTSNPLPRHIQVLFPYIKSFF